MKRITPQDVVNVINKKYRSDILTVTKGKDILRERDMAIYLMFYELRTPTSEIMEMFNKSQKYIRDCRTRALHKIADTVYYSSEYNEILSILNYKDEVLCRIAENINEDALNFHENDFLVSMHQ